MSDESDTSSSRRNGRKTSTVISTQIETVTATPTPTPTPTSLTTTSSASTSSASDSSATSSSSSSPHLLPLGAIVGGVVAALIVVLLLFIFLLLKRRASRRKSRLRAEIDPPMSLIPAGLDLGRDDSVNDGSSSAVARLSSAPSTVYPPQRALSMPSPSISPLRGKPSTRTTHTVHPLTRDEENHPPYASTSNLEVHLSMQSYSTHDWVPNSAASAHSATYLQHHWDPNKPHFPTDSPIDESDYSDHAEDLAPPAYSRNPTLISPSHHNP